MSMENSHDTIGIRARDLTDCGAVSEQNYATTYPVTVKH